ncbi:hypothetical protein V6Z11_D02G154400 [Gossypium hirsutum]
MHLSVIMHLFSILAKTQQAMNVVQFNLLMEMVHSMILESKVLSRK